MHWSAKPVCAGSIPALASTPSLSTGCAENRARRKSSVSRKCKRRASVLRMFESVRDAGGSAANGLKGRLIRRKRGRWRSCWKENEEKLDTLLSLFSLTPALRTQGQKSVSKTFSIPHAQGGRGTLNPPVKPTPSRSAKPPGCDCGIAFSFASGDWSRSKARAAC